MIYGELLEFLYEKGLNEPDFLQETATVYDKKEGEYYPCDTIEFCDSDSVLDKDQFFLSIER
tara:strand:- start:159 stop:344 length:186 start_codon:yes stop_codon:yes gene_type:complete